MWILKAFKGDTLQAQLITSQAQAITVGRQGCDLNLEDKSVSRRHACIVNEGDGVVLEDLKSRFGTKLNGAAVSGRQELACGDRIVLGAAESEPLIVERENWVLCLPQGEHELAGRLSGDLGIACSDRVDPSTTHFVHDRSVEVGESFLRMMAFQIPMCSLESIRSLLDTRIPILDPLAQVQAKDDEPSHVSLQIDRTRLLEAYHVIVRDASLKPVVEAFGATCSAQPSAGRTNVNLGHFETENPTMTLTELAQAVASNDISALKAIETQFAKGTVLGPLGSPEAAPTATRPAKKGVAVNPGESEAKMVVECSPSVFRPAPPTRAESDDPPGSVGNFKKFQKTQVRRNLTCIGVADMVLSKSALASGANEHLKEAWLEEDRRAAPKRLNDGLGEVRKAAGGRTPKVNYQPVQATIAESAPPVEKVVRETSKAGFRSSFFASIT